jgi:hypothetical protein
MQLPFSGRVKVSGGGDCARLPSATEHAARRAARLFN